MDAYECINFFVLTLNIFECLGLGNLLTRSVNEFFTIKISETLLLIETGTNKK